MYVNCCSICSALSSLAFEATPRRGLIPVSIDEHGEHDDDDDGDVNDANADVNAENALEWVLAHSCVSHIDLYPELDLHLNPSPNLDHLQAHRSSSRLDHVRLLLLFVQFEGGRIAEQMEGHTRRCGHLQVSSAGR